MIYTERLLALSEYRKLLEELKAAEQYRDLCRHDLAHFMDVARIGRVIACEQNLQLTADDIYLAALLHDVGRMQEYKHGIPHEEAGVNIATTFLEDIDYPVSKRNTILAAVAGHRAEKEDEDLLTKVIRTADKLSRPCFLCKIADECYWPEELKNKSFFY